MEAFSVFRNHHIHRADIRHVPHDRISSCGRSVFATMHFGDLGTFNTRKVHLSTILSLTARAIYPPGRWRGWLDLSENFLPSKQKISRSRLERGLDWALDWFSSFSTNRGSLSRSISVFLSYVRLIELRGTVFHRNIFYFDPSKGVGCFLPECTIHGSNT